MSEQAARRGLDRGAVAPQAPTATREDPATQGRRPSEPINTVSEQAARRGLDRGAVAPQAPTATREDPATQGRRPSEPINTVLTVDLGTTAVKVGLATVTGRVIWHEEHPLQTVLLPGGGAEQDAEGWWQLITGAARRALGSGAVDPASVRAVAVVGQWASTVPVDESGEPVGPCVLWMDSRGGPEATRRVGGPVAGYAPGKLLSWVRRSGGAPSLDGADPLGHRWFLQTSRPDLHARARWLLEPVDYLTMRFTGRATATPASMTGSWLTDNRDLGTIRYDPTLIRLAGLDAGKLPALQGNGTLIGPILPAVAASLGLPEGVPVVTGLTDAHAVALGSGAVADFEPHLSLGTTSWVACHVPFKKTDVINQVASVPGTLPGRYLVVNNHETSGRCLHWLRQVLENDETPFDELTAQAATAAPGSGGVIFTPWLAGERTPIADRNARGGFHNVSLSTTRADLIRAVLEGVALNDLWTLQVVERFTNRRLDHLRTVGGGACSPLWCQIHADVLDRTIDQVSEPMLAGLRGGALGAGLALGLIEVHELRDLVPVTATFHPDPERVAVYRRLFAEFPRLYRVQRKMFARLNAQQP